MVSTRLASKLSDQKRENASHRHHDTPTKARIRAQYEEFKVHDYSGTNTKTLLYSRIGIPRRSINRILASEFSNPSHRTFHNDPAIKETRGRPKLITDDDLHRMEAIIQSCDVQGRAMTWETLGYEAGITASPRTIQRAMGRLDYRKCIACRKGWVNKELGQ